MKATDSTSRPALWGSQGWLGFVLLAVYSPLNWSLPGNCKAYLFFPLWLGYILVVDAVVLSGTGTSLWAHSRRGFAMLFITSVPAWWIFEAMNRRTANWECLGSAVFTDLGHYLLYTISYSTVTYPKWIFHTPGAQFLHIFEMPLLGYAGYVPFALGLWALKNLLWTRSPSESRFP
jgi:hypothetical protein